MPFILRNLKFREVSAVDKGAGEGVQIILRKQGSNVPFVNIPVVIEKVDAEKRQVFGWASVSTIDGKIVVDKQGDIIEPAELEKAAYDFVQHSRDMGAMHEQTGVGRLIESCVFTKEKQQALGIDLGREGWFVGFVVDDEPTWQACKRGVFPEFSIGGVGERAPVQKTAASSFNVEFLTKSLTEAHRLSTDQERAVRHLCIDLESILNNNADVVRKGDAATRAVEQFSSAMARSGVSRSEAEQIAEQVAEALEKRRSRRRSMEPARTNKPQEKEFSEMTDKEQAEHLRSVLKRPTEQRVEIQKTKEPEMQIITKSAASDAMRTYAARRAQIGEGVEFAYARLLKSDPLIRQMYHAYCNTPPDPEPIASELAKAALVKPTLDINKRAAELRKNGVHPERAFGMASEEYHRRMTAESFTKSAVDHAAAGIHERAAEISKSAHLSKERALNLAISEYAKRERTT